MNKPTPNKTALGQKRLQREDTMWGQNGKAKQSGNPEDQNFTFLGGGVDFKGVFTFDGTVRIDGRLEGEIHTKGTLVVGENAVIKGTITAGTLITSGKINGNVTAIEKVQLQKPAILIGDVRTPVLSMQDGSHIHGMSNMCLHRWSEAEALAAE
ncbi:MAG: bactofilin family protein, partial [Nitrospirales bacterium]